LDLQASFLSTQEVVLEDMEETEVMAMMDLEEWTAWMLQDIHAERTVVLAVQAAMEEMPLVV
jgi:hypothetical protein